MIIPEYNIFASHYNANEAQCVAIKLVGDLETPISAYLKLRRNHSKSPSFLLESVEGGETCGRYSILGFDPDLIWQFRAEKNVISRIENDELKWNEEEINLSPLETLRNLIEISQIPNIKDLPPMASGIFGFLGYDMVRYMEELGEAKQDNLNIPDAFFIRPTLLAIFDAVKDEITLITPIFPKKGISAKVAYEKASDKLLRAIDALEKPLNEQTSYKDINARLPEPVSNTSPEEYKSMVRGAKEYIMAGDIFQVVLSQKFSCSFDLPAFSLYRALRRINPSPYLCYLDCVDFQIVCSSPEILVKALDGSVTIRPIAGTRPRGKTPAQDKQMEEELLQDKKERAEHLMLLDLGRNDVGRVSKIGSVEVKDSFFVERYSQVMHIVSHVEGELGSKFDVIDALCAGFPAGTVSGAPKIRAMQIIDELEKEKRGVYAGGIGYFGSDGNMDSCIVLRTAIVKDGMMHVQAGAGIVYDSIPEKEQEECENKAKALFRAAEEAVRFASLGKNAQ